MWLQSEHKWTLYRPLMPHDASLSILSWWWVLFHSVIRQYDTFAGTDPIHFTAKMLPPKGLSSALAYRGKPTDIGNDWKVLQTGAVLCTLVCSCANAGRFASLYDSVCAHASYRVVNHWSSLANFLEACKPQNSGYIHATLEKKPHGNMCL